MAHQFEFLAKAKPAGLYRLLQKMPREEAAIVLAGLPPGLSVQVMAFFPESEQAELLPALREARQAPPEKADAVVAGLRDMAAAARVAPVDGAPGIAAPVATPAAAPSRPRPLAKPVAGGAAASGKPVPWTPRAAAGSPINGPAVAGKPPVSGDPFQSPLAKAGLMDLIGRAQEKLLPRRSAPSAGVSSPSRRSAVPAKKESPGQGVVGRGAVTLSRTPRTVGPRPKNRDGDATPAARPLDGKAVLAAILRAADSGVRGNVEHDDPNLYRELRNRMFVFDDLIYTEDAALARVFTAAPTGESALALKFAAPALRERVLRAVSPGRAAVLREPPAGKTGFDAIERAQNRVLAVALQLQAAGRILIDPRDPDLVHSQF